MSWQISLSRPWLTVDFGQSLETIGWTLQAGGVTHSQKVLWREVRDADLSLDFQVEPWLAAQTLTQAAPKAPCFLTSRSLAHYTSAETCIEGITARAIATSGLGNAEQVGARIGAREAVGTINLLVGVDVALHLPAKLELLSLMAEARTLAMVEKGLILPTGLATGTGTDCLCLASLPALAQTPESAAGKHTALGEAAGQVALQALRQAIQDWQPPTGPFA